MVQRLGMELLYPEQRLPAAVASYPSVTVELIKPQATAVASPIPAVSHCSLVVTKGVGQGQSPVFLHEAWCQLRPAQDIPNFEAWAANVQAGGVRAAGSIVEHGHSVCCMTAFGVNVIRSKVLKKARASSLCCLG